MGYEIEIEKKEEETFKKKERIIMKTQKIYKIMLMALMLFAASLSITSVDAEAKAYKAKTITVTSGKSKTVKTSKKIKKVAICSTNKNFTVKKTGDKKFKVSGTNKGKTQTVKVTYTNKYTQKFKIKTKAAAKKTTTMPSYAKKIVDKLKPLLADPDKGLQTAMTWWEKPRDNYENVFTVHNCNDNRTVKTVSILYMDDIMKTYTASQKKALILELYFRTRMTYSGADKGKYNANRNSDTYFKKLYNGTFKGVCADGAEMGYDICKLLGLKAKCTGSMEMDHGWCAIYVTDKNGVSYWHGIYTTSYGYNLKGTASVPNGWTMTKAQFNKAVCQPNNQTRIVVFRKRIKTTRTPATTTAPSVTTTQVPAVTPTPAPTQTTTTVIFNTPEPAETKTPAAITEPTKAPVASQEPAQTVQPTVTPIATPTETPVVTPEPTVEPTPVPTETPAPQRILIPHAEHGYTCSGCNPLNPPPVRHTSKTNPYITNIKATYKTYEVYQHVIGTEVRWFDADGNEYIDVNNDGNIIDELIQLAG